jgi:hypothetical protein
MGKFDDSFEFQEPVEENIISKMDEDDQSPPINIQSQISEDSYLSMPGEFLNYTQNECSFTRN